MNEKQWEVDSLRGNINRMCVTRDEKELVDMREVAKWRIDKIFEIRQGEIREANHEQRS